MGKGLENHMYNDLDNPKQTHEEINFTNAYNKQRMQVIKKSHCGACCCAGTAGGRWGGWSIGGRETLIGGIPVMSRPQGIPEHGTDMSLGQSLVAGMFIRQKNRVPK